MFYRFLHSNNLKRNIIHISQKRNYNRQPLREHLQNNSLLAFMVTVNTPLAIYNIKQAIDKPPKTEIMNLILGTTSFLCFHPFALPLTTAIFCIRNSKKILNKSHS